jgi:hypothetical protein
MQEILERMSRLHASHPENAVVTHVLGGILVRRSGYLPYYFPDRAREAIACGTRAQQLLRRQLVREPENKHLRRDYVNSFVPLAYAYDSANERSQAIESGRTGMALMDEMLREDPGNIMLVENSATTAMELSHRLAHISRREARDFELIARRHWQTLRELEPAREWYQLNFAWAHLVEAKYYHLQEGLIERSRSAYAKFVATLTPLAQKVDQYVALRGAIRIQGELAAAAGDRESARELLEQSRAWQQQIGGNGSAAGRNDANRRAANIAEECAVFEALHEWAELEGSAGDLIAIVDGAEPHGAEGHDLLRERARGGTWLGLVLLRNGHAKEAIPFFEEALAFHLGDDAGANKRRRTIAVRNRLAEALLATGSRPRAQQLLEDSLKDAEAENVARGDYWYPKRLLAETSYLLASVLDPATADAAARRESLLERAMQVLTKPGVEERLTVDDRDLLANVRDALETR